MVLWSVDFKWTAASLCGASLELATSVLKSPYRALKGDIAIVMSDSRALAKDNETLGYHDYAFLANLRYASKHGYDYRYYHIVGGKLDTSGEPEGMKNGFACHHPVEGWRASPWCKIISTLHALEQGKP